MITNEDQRINPSREDRRKHLLLTWPGWSKGHFEKVLYRNQNYITLSRGTISKTANLLTLTMFHLHVLKDTVPWTITLVESGHYRFLHHKWQKATTFALKRYHDLIFSTRVTSKPCDELASHRSRNSTSQVPYVVKTRVIPQGYGWRSLKLLNLNLMSATSRGYHANSETLKW